MNLFGKLAFFVLRFTSITFLKQDSTVIAMHKFYGDVQKEFEDFHGYIRLGLKSEPEPLCDLSKGKKVAICAAILGNELINQLITTPSNPTMFLNKVAFYHHTPFCETHTLTVNYKVRTSTSVFTRDHNIFPCYGRHEPTRTAWNIDEYYNALYVSGGPIPDSVFLYMLGISPKTEVMKVVGLLYDVGINNLPSITLTGQDLETELRWSINNNIPEIEINYVQSVVNEGNLLSDTICDLHSEQKKALCKVILGRDVYSNLFFVIDESAFDNFSADCDEEIIEFNGELTKPYNDDEIKQKMFPCYIKSRLFENYPSDVDTPDLENNPFSENPDYQSPIITFRLSHGFKQESIMVYHKYASRYIFYEFIENIKLSDVLVDF